MSHSTLTPAPTPVSPIAPLAEADLAADTMEGVESSTDLAGDLFGETPAEAEETEKEREEKREGEDEEGDGEEEEDERDNTGEENTALAVIDADAIVPARKLTFVDYLSSPIVTITVGDTVLTAHLALLQRSPFFNFSNSPAGYPLTVDGLIDESLDAVGCFLQYLYTNEYTPRLIPSTLHAGEMVLDSVSYDEIDEDGSHLLKHARVYTLAEKLGMEELKTLAHSKIHRINSTAKGELAYAKFVYANTSKDDKTIRSPIASFWAHRSHILRHEAESEFKGMILEFPQFAYDILSMVLDQKEKGKERGYRGDREEREGTQLTDMAPPGTAEKRPGSTRKRPRTSTLM